MTTEAELRALDREIGQRKGYRVVRIEGSRLVGSVRLPEAPRFQLRDPQGRGPLVGSVYAGERIQLWRSEDEAWQADCPRWSSDPALALALLEELGRSFTIDRGVPSAESDFMWWAQIHSARSPYCATFAEAAARAWLAAHEGRQG